MKSNFTERGNIIGIYCFALLVFIFLKEIIYFEGKFNWLSTKLKRKQRVEMKQDGVGGKQKLVRCCLSEENF
jgi:hypothetical protein